MTWPCYGGWPTARRADNGTFRGKRCGGTGRGFKVHSQRCVSSGRRTRLRPLMGLLSSLVVGSPMTARQPTTHVIRAGGAGRLIFCSSNEESAAVQKPQESVEKLWSPELTAERRGVKECNLEHVFSLPSAATSSEGESSSAAPPELSTCCICLEDIQRNTNALHCPHCTMEAHPFCLERWFTSGRGLVPKESASCPSCRRSIDWDTMALRARREGRRPLGSMLRTSENSQNAFQPDAPNGLLVGGFQHCEPAVATSSPRISPRTARLERGGGRCIALPTAGLASAMFCARAPTVPATPRPRGMSVRRAVPPGPLVL